MADATRVYWVERGQIAIATSNDYFNTFTSPTEVKTVRVYCVKRPNQFAITSDIDYTQTTDLHDDFHNAVLYKVSQWLHETNPETLQVAQYMEVQYDKELSKAKKMANTENINGSVIIRGYDY
tara:strand:+ start:67 stop:435 length:369 start_codon:yes stop_codon:yes gene_type:complete